MIGGGGASGDIHYGDRLGDGLQESGGKFVAVVWRGKLPLRTLAMSLGLPHSPKMSTRGEERKGVCQAWVNL